MYRWTTARRPAGPIPVGFQGFNTTLGAPEYWDGATWVGFGGVGVGDSPAWTGTHTFQGQVNLIRSADPNATVVVNTPMVHAPASVQAIAAGVVTFDFHSCYVQAQTGTTDDLDTLNVGPHTVVDGEEVRVRPDATHTITLKHGTGNLDLGGSDIVLTDSEVAILSWDGHNSLWIVPNQTAMGGGGGAPASAVGDVQVDDGAGGWAAASPSGGNDYLTSLGGATAAFQVGVPVADVVSAGAPGADLAPVGATVAATAAPGPAWSATGPYSTMLNGMMPLPVGSWFEKL